MLKGNSVISKNKGTSLWNFVLNSGLRKFRHGISIVEPCYQLSSRKVDAPSVINWAVVGQLTPTLNHCSLSHRLSSAVYSTILPHGTVLATANTWFRTCRRPASSFCTVAWQLARFQLTRRIPRPLGDSRVSCLHMWRFCISRKNSLWYCTQVWLCVVCSDAVGHDGARFARVGHLHQTTRRPTETWRKLEFVSRAGVLKLTFYL